MRRGSANRLSRPLPGSCASTSWTAERRFRIAEVLLVSPNAPSGLPFRRLLSHARLPHSAGCGAGILRVVEAAGANRMGEPDADLGCSAMWMISSFWVREPALRALAPAAAG